MIYDSRKIIALREGLKLSQAELARRSGISQPTLWAIEHQMTKEPEAKTMINIASALGVPLRELLKKSAGKAGDLEADMADAFKLLDDRNKQALLAAARALLNHKPK